LSPANRLSVCPSSTNLLGDTTKEAQERMTGATRAKSPEMPQNTRPKDNRTRPIR
ncbi:hypothetical protein M9458_047868, partial [Cirrhinus mrigala]